MNGEIIELEGEPEPAPWRPGSLTIVVAPLLAVALLVAALGSVGRPALDVAAPSGRPAETPLGPEFYSLPRGIIATRPPSDVLSFNGETGDPEMLENDPWMGVGPTYSGRGDVAEAVLYGDAYVIGGSGSSVLDGRQVYRYDRRTGMRIRAPDLPISLDHAMAATLDDRIFVFGGFVFGRPSPRVFSLGSNDTDWVEHTPMSAPRAAGGVAVVGNRAYLVGGVGANGDWVRDVWLYEGGKLISGLAPIPTPRDHLAVGTYEGRICAAGGNGGERAFECYSPVRNEWTRMPDLRRPTIGARAAEAAGWFWVIAQDVHVFTADHWHFGPRLLTPRSGHAAVVLEGAIYVIEGAPGVPTARMERITPHP